MGSTSKLQESTKASECEDDTAQAVLNALARNVIAARTKRRWSQADLAEAAGVTQQRISLLEGGRGGRTIETVSRLAIALKTTVGKLLSE